MLRDLRERFVSDREFDALYPAWVRRHSRIHFSPLKIALQAAELLVENDSSRILDVGSGAGKFCLAGAAIFPAQFVGVEQRADLVEVAQDLAATHKISNATFICGDAMDLDWNLFDALYFYNPFGEHIFIDPEERIRPREGYRSPLAWSEAQYENLIRETAKRLREMKLGTRVATYHGYGRYMPTGYTLKYSATNTKAPFSVWTKSAW